MKGCRPLQDSEITAVAQSFSGEHAARDRALFLLGLKSGFRISELLSLTLGALHQGGRMVDRVTVQRRNMKKRIEGRTVLLHPEAKAAHPLEKGAHPFQRVEPMPCEQAISGGA